MNQKEYFKLNQIDVGFADHPTEGTIFIKGALNSEVLIRNGKLRINLLTPALQLGRDLHNGTLDDPYYENKRQIDHLRLCTYQDLAIPGATYDTQITCPYDNIAGFEVYGFPEQLKFHGIIDVQEGYIEIKGELKTSMEENTASIPVEVRKLFEPKPLIPPRTRYTLEEARQVDPLEVYELTLDKGDFPLFPEEVLDYKNLESFSIGMQTNCTFRALPDAFYDLKQLHRISICYSPFDTLSERIGALQNLEELLLTSAQLRQLPDAITQLPNLRVLNLRYNKLTELPAQMGHLPALKSLDIRSNPFKHLPETLTQIYDLSADRQQRKLFMDVSYKSKNPEPINTSLYDLSRYPEAKERLSQAIAQIPELQQFKDFLLETSTMATYLVLDEAQQQIPIGTSKVGGSPDLPKDWKHPANKNGVYFVFHAQINCEEIASYQPYLPRKGMLYFFVNDEEYAQHPFVLYTDQTNNLERIPYTEATSFSDSTFNNNFRKATAIRFQNGIALPDFYRTASYFSERFPNHIKFRESLDEDFDWDNILDFTEKLEEDLGRPLAFDNGHIQIRSHSINSFVFTQGEWPQQQAAEALGGEPTNWLVLLCMESAGEFSFWDAGTLTYCIHKKDLAIKDFSKIHTSIESS